MNDERMLIADRVRGIATEKRCSQQRVADILGLSRGAVSERYNGRVEFGARELMVLARTFGVPITRFFPEDVQTTVRVAA